MIELLTMNLTILVGASLVVVSILTSVISFRIGAPLLLLFLGIGLLAGEDGLGGIDFDNAPAAWFIGSIALAIILFDSGFATPLARFRTAGGPAITLATIGVVLTSAILGAMASVAFGLSWMEGMLMGAIVGSTDAAAVFFLLRVGGITLRDRVRSTLEIESGSNDPVAIFLTIGLVEFITASSVEQGIWHMLQILIKQVGVGAVFGILGGLLIAQTVNRLQLETALYPLLVVALALMVFASTSTLGGSGFLAVYVAGVVAGNARLQHSAVLRRFQDGLTWLAQIAMFLTLGLLATPSSFPDVLLPAVLLALALIFLARPLAVWLCLLPFGFTRNETTFVAWVGLRGAVSILLAIVPLMAGLENAQLFFNVAFLMVLVSLLIQGWTVRPIARWLGLIVPARQGPVDRVELELPGQAKQELVAYRIAADSPVGRGERIPRWARPALIVRNGRSMNVHTAGRLQPDDYIYIFIPPEQVHLLDRLFARRAKLDPDDREFWGDFLLTPDVRLSILADSYGLPVPEGDRGLTVAEYLKRSFGGRLELGDRLRLGEVELIVRELDDEDNLAAVGLAVEPTRPSRPRLPLFQSWPELAALLKRRWR
ncbi:potassium/proton antiporter [Telmatospirillum sp. J64-1]|uniref:potassium/proton antiporter n=1 Tax=Telmatospirillum sp. J64-1 TaxID=2502183 RepID=UPI001C8F354A|nr:potassium/proton antiporter [Telmatospirillum sp. J64-1]